MKRLSNLKWAALAGTAALTLSVGCGPSAEPLPEPADTVSAPVTESLNPERRGIGALPLPTQTSRSAQAVLVDSRRSLMVTDDSLLAGFTFARVMNQIVSTSGVSTTSLDVFHQWWDTARTTASGLALGPHCDSPGVANMNGFPYTCPRVEGDQATMDPFTAPDVNPSAYVPIGLSNRFDLAPVNGSNCGEYRIVFARRSGFTNGLARNLIIFEAVLPNPNPAAGLEGCRPVANFWASLSGLSTTSSRAAELERFYFTGLSGFMPVVHADNLGNRPSDTGQVRTNQFLQANWMLREFKVRKECVSTGSCALRFIPVTVKTNPGGNLFNPASTHALAPAFQNTDFPSQVPSLAINDINLFGLSLADGYNSGQSDEQSTVENHYVNQFGTGSSTLRTHIQAQLTALSSPLTPDHIVARAMAQSCAGCHQLSNGANLGGGLIWPNSLRFVHVAEATETGPDGLRHRISPALTNVFLPHREAVLETFLNSSCGDLTCQPWESHSVCSADCP